MTEHEASKWSMADVSGKPVSRRVAVAAGTIRLGEEAFSLVERGEMPKGDPLAMAEVAGMLAAKRTPDLLPLCHPISLNRVVFRAVARPDEYAYELFCAAEIDARTGVEMEALTGLSVALLTFWDLAKPVNPSLEIANQRLLYKSGGKRGTWLHPDGIPGEAEELIAELQS